MGRGTLDELADGIRRLEAAMAGLRREQLAAVAELARRCGHVVDGCAAPVDWLMMATTCSRPTARRHVDVAVALGGLPGVADAFGSGVLSFDQVAQLVRFVTPDTERAWADGAVGRSVHELEALARSLRPPSRAQLVDARARRCLRLRDDDQETRITGRVPVAEGALLRALLEPLAADVAADAVADTLDHWGARMADALCQRAAQQPPRGPGPGGPPSSCTPPPTSSPARPTPPPPWPRP
ncbi:MAG: DUF222 domain-containing protein [Acidimicrobiales bacterium]|nr:DUF222 domain-containing protein [Acidimicrobiales bacterium]